MPLILKNEPTVQFREIAKIFITSFDRHQTSRLQKYRLTKKGRDLLEKQTKETGVDEK
jgi:hypothetical protein